MMEFRSPSGGRKAPNLPLAGSLLARVRRVPRLLVFLLLLCFVVEGTAVQSHVHFVRQASRLAATSGATYVETAPAGKGDSPADCPLCQEAAMAGAYVLPPVPVLPPPPAPVLWTVAAILPAFALLAPSLGWLSRAPPE
jgi:hypothetical protein